MAVPIFGEVSLLGLAREKQFDDYNSTSTPYTPISLLDLAETFQNFDGTNVNGVTYPDDQKPHAVSEWRGYDHDYGIQCPLAIQLGYATTLGNDPCSSPARTYYVNITSTTNWCSTTQILRSVLGSSACEPAAAGFYYFGGTYSGSCNPVAEWNGSSIVAFRGCP